MERDVIHGFSFQIPHISTHTLTWSVTRGARRVVPPAKHFNSHAHVERDRGRPPAPPIRKISTHTLTWSVTNSFEKLFTLCFYFNSHAHVERDIGNSSISDAHTHFNSHAHVERDKNDTNNRRWGLHFNSHAHVERDPPQPAAFGILWISTHTLTWSVTLPS